MVGDSIRSNIGNAPNVAIDGNAVTTVLQNAMMDQLINRLTSDSNACHGSFKDMTIRHPECKKVLCVISGPINVHRGQKITFGR